MGRVNWWRLALVGVLVLLVLILGAFFLSYQLAIRPLHATAMAEYAALLGERTAIAGTITAAADTAKAGLTQQSVYLQQTADSQATRQAAEETRVVADATDLAATQIVANKCTVNDLYDLEVSRPTLNPPQGKVYTLGAQPFDVYATWTVTNTGECPWNDVRLRVEGGDSFIPQVLDRVVGPGESVELVVHFAFSGAGDLGRVGNVSGEWFVVVKHPVRGDISLQLDRPHLVLAVEGWIVPVAPTPWPTKPPTPTYTPTPTPTPTSTSTPVATVCSEVCEECRECVQYEDPKDPSSACLRWGYYPCPPCRSVCGTPTPVPGPD